MQVDPAIARPVPRADASILAFTESSSREEETPLEAFLADQILPAADESDLIARLDAILDMSTYRALRAQMRQAVTANMIIGAAVTGEASPNPKIVRGAGSENRDRLETIGRLLVATTRALLQYAAHAAASGERLPQATEVYFSDTGYLVDPRSPVEVKEMVLGAEHAEACIWALHAAAGRSVRTELRRAIVDTAERGLRGYLRGLASLPGVEAPADVSIEPLRVTAIEASHAATEAAYQKLLAEARASNAAVWPPIEDNDD